MVTFKKAAIAVVSATLFTLFLGCSSSSSSSEDETSSSSTDSPSSSSAAENSSSSFAETGTFTDTRDDQVYKYVTIGSQIWMAENLNYDTLDATGSWCYENIADNCTTYGRLYDWSTVMNLNDSCNTKVCSDQVQTVHKGICPQGWHVPSDAELTVLTAFIGEDVAGTKLKAASGWSSDGNGTDDYGFSALPGGGRGYNSAFNDIDEYGFWWTTTEDESRADHVYLRLMNSNDEDVTRLGDYKITANSIRCLKD